LNKKLFLGIAVLGSLGISLVGAASAGQPANPGCFGNDRATTINNVFKNGGSLDTAPGASEWGQIAGDRAGTNGDQNRDYKTFCGGDPTP
jgi:hypothetical protein